MTWEMQPGNAKCAVPNASFRMRRAEFVIPNALLPRLRRHVVVATSSSTPRRHRHVAIATSSKREKEEVGKKGKRGKGGRGKKRKMGEASAAVESPLNRLKTSKIQKRV